MASPPRTTLLRRALVRPVLWASLGLLCLPAHTALASQSADLATSSTPGSPLGSTEPPPVPEAPAPGQASEPKRSLSQVRHLLVKALGHGATKWEAEQQALHNARSLAAGHLAALGGSEALDPGEDAQRIVTMRHFPTLGFGAPRAVVLLELRLRDLLPPLKHDTTLLVLRANVEAGVLHLEANRRCGAVAAYLPAPEAEPKLLPGGVRTLRLSQSKAVRQNLPPGVKSLNVLACTGGLALPPNPGSMDEVFTHARPGRPQPHRVEGVVSDCVELRLHLGEGG